MPYLLGNRNDRIAHLSGHAVVFKAGEITWVPEDARLVEICTQHGHTLAHPATPEKVEKVEKEAPLDLAPAQAATAKKAL